MEVIEGYDHQPGVHCGAAALRNVTAYYDLTYSEAACFGIGGGPAFVLYERPDEPWVTFRASPTWLERAFFERLGIPHSFRQGDDFETAWANVTARVDDDDPVLLFLDPEPLAHLPEERTHLPPHVAVVVGYDDETVQLSDGATAERQSVSHSTLAAAWTRDAPVPLDHEYLHVTRVARTEDETDAIAAGLRQAATYMLDPLEVKRDARGPGEEGIPAIRSFAADVGTWPDLPEPARPVRAARRSIDEHGDGTAFRALYADALDELGQRTGLATDVADRMERVGSEWETVADLLETALDAGASRSASLTEAASVLADVADREAAIFEDVRDELGGLGEE